MYPTSSKPEINVSSLPLISGFQSNDYKTFNKTINHLNQEYTVTITFKVTDSPLQKTTFLKKINEDIENTINISVKLGLGSVKGATSVKPTRDYTITSLKFQSDDNIFKSSKIKTNKDGTTTTTPFKDSPIFKEGDTEVKRTRKEQKHTNLRLIQSIYEKAKDAHLGSNKIVQPQNQQPKEPFSIAVPENKKPIYQPINYPNNLSINNQIATISISLKPQENLKSDESCIKPVETHSKLLSPRETPIIDINDDDYSKLIEEYKEEIKSYLKRQAILLNDYNNSDLFKCTDSYELKKCANNNIPENFSQIITDKNIFTTHFKESIYYKKTEAKNFIINNNKKILEALSTFIDKYKTESDTLKNKGEENKTNQLKSIADEWSLNIEITPFLDYLPYEGQSPILNPITFFDNYKKHNNFDSLLYPITYLHKESSQ